MKVAALILAAGFARRFGSDKRRLLVPSASMASQTLLEFTVAKYATVFDHCYVVMRDADELPAAWNSTASVTVLTQNNNQAGMGDNLALSARHVYQQGADAMVIALADMPLVEASTLEHLKALSAVGAIVVPCCGGLRGHPVLFGREYFAALAELSGDVGARSVLAANASRVVTLETNDAGVLEDVDTIDDWQRIKKILQAGM